MSEIPEGLSVGGRALWVSVTEAHTLDAVQAVTLLEACRAKDRLDKLDGLLRGDAGTWATVDLDPASGGDVFELRITSALAQANATANLLKQLLAALRLPDDVSGKRPQQRGGARGAYKPTAAPGSKVSSLDRARAAKSS
jgi:hypothetical protein